MDAVQERGWAVLGVMLRIIARVDDGRWDAFRKFATLDDKGSDGVCSNTSKSSKHARLRIPTSENRFRGETLVQQASVVRTRDNTYLPSQIWNRLAHHKCERFGESPQLNRERMSVAVRGCWARCLQQATARCALGLHRLTVRRWRVSIGQRSST